MRVRLLVSMRILLWIKVLGLQRVAIETYYEIVYDTINSFLLDRSFENGMSNIVVGVCLLIII